jgi:hypothetical protein
MIDLTTYPAIQSNLFVRIEVDSYKATAGSTPISTVLRFSDYGRNYTIDSESYTGLGRLMGVTTTTSELRVSEFEVSVTLSGIPNASISEIINSKIKGCPIKIYRVLFNPDTNAVLSIAGNPMIRFIGIVNNYSLNEEYDGNDRSGSNTLVLNCTSEVSVLSNKIGGLRTNPESLKVFEPTDISFDRVPNLKNTTFNFGA